MKQLSPTAHLRGSSHSRGRASRFGLALTFAALTASGVASAATRYVFATFGGDEASKEKLSLYTSKNGLDFTLLSNTGYSGPTGVLRDPSIMKHSDGQYYIAYTLKSWTTTSSAFAIASSPNLKTWTFRTEVPAQVTGVKDTWAPEWFKDSDGSIHLIVSIDTSTTQFKSYLYTASDDTLSKWDAPKPLGIGPNYIDTFVVKIGALYHAFTKNETTKFIEHATSDAVTGPWTFVGKDDWAGWGSGKEGPALFQLDNGQWRLLMDCYGNCGFLQATSTDLNKWSSTSMMPGLSGVVRHGTVLREDDAMTGSGGTSGVGGANQAGANAAGASSAGATNGGASAAGAGNANSGGSAGLLTAAGASSAIGGASGQSSAGGTPPVTSGAGGSTARAGSSGSTASNASGGSDSTIPASDGCSCSLPNSDRSTHGTVASLLAALAVFHRRRANRESPTR